MPQAEPIRAMFNNIARSYDILNDLLSLGIHRLWKRQLINKMLEVKPATVLDCATGTGDIAIAIKQKNPSLKITGIDFSENMLNRARLKTTDIAWETQDVTKLPYDDATFDVSSISYGIRNVENMQLALKEMARVSRKRFCILEFGQPDNTILKGLYFGVMKYFIPFMGKLFNKEDAYSYLIDSSLKFPSGEKMVTIIKDATSFDHVSCTPIMGGITYLYTASRDE